MDKKRLAGQARVGVNPEFVVAHDMTRGDGA